MNIEDIAQGTVLVMKPYLGISNRFTFHAYIISFHERLFSRLPALSTLIFKVNVQVTRASSELHWVS